jgi:hypothetical protein
MEQPLCPKYTLPYLHADAVNARFFEAKVIRDRKKPPLPALQAYIFVLFPQHKSLHLKMQAARTPETLVLYHDTTHHNPENFDLNTRYRFKINDTDGIKQ